MQNYKLIFIAIFIIISSIAKSQNTIDTYSQYNDEGKAAIYAVNNGYCDYYVTINFSRLENLKPDRGFPYAKSIPSGERRILTLTPIDRTQRSHFNYSFTSLKGRANPEVNKDIVYLMPIKEGTSCIVASSRLEDRLPKVFESKLSQQNYEALIFNLNEGDTIYAARSGNVSDIQFYDTEKEFDHIEIFHSDGTFGMYGGIYKSLKRIGDNVLAGEPIAIIGNYKKHLLNFSVYFLDSRKLDMKGVSPYSSYYPKFITKNEGVLPLESSKEYISIHPVEIITLGMTKKQKKKYLKAQGN